MSDERAALLAELAAQRRHVVGALDGLTPEQRTTAMVPSGWPPIAVLHHLAYDVERWWFAAVVAGDPNAWAYFDANPGGAWTVPDGIDVVAVYEQESAASDAVLATADLDAPAAHWPDGMGEPQSVREVVLHVIAETATHAGQLDVVRELIDGRTWLVLD